MSSTFSITRLAHHEALIRGADDFGIGRVTKISTQQFDALAHHKQQHIAGERFDASIAVFFKPLTDAAEAAAALLEQPEDELFTEVLHEGVEGVEEVREEKVALEKDTVILKLIEKGDTSRLMWVGDEIEILAL